MEDLKELTMEEIETDKWCIDGQWKDGVCVCNPGRATFFDGNLLTQRYCDSDDNAVAVLKTSYPPRHYLHLFAMTLTVLLTVVAVAVLATAIAQVVRKVLIMTKISRAKQEVAAFENGRLLRDDVTDLTVTFWAPPKKYICISQQERGGEIGGVRAKVVAAYNPQNAGELPLKPGVTITNVEQLERGWCKGTIDGKTGFFPAAFVEILT